MRFSTRIRYGIRTMVEVAMSGGDEGVLQKDIAERQGISNKYLDHIVSALKTARLVKNSKGKKSGYVLAKPACDITVLDIHNAFEPGINLVDCLVPGYACKKDGACASQGFFCGLNQQVNDYFKGTSLQDLVDQQQQFAPKANGC